MGFRVEAGSELFSWHPFRVASSLRRLWLKALSSEIQPRIWLDDIAEERPYTAAVG